MFIATKTRRHTDRRDDIWYLKKKQKNCSLLLRSDPSLNCCLLFTSFFSCCIQMRCLFCRHEGHEHPWVMIYRQASSRPRKTCVFLQHCSLFTVNKLYYFTDKEEYRFYSYLNTGLCWVGSMCLETQLYP